MVTNRKYSTIFSYDFLTIGNASVKNKVTDINDFYKQTYNWQDSYIHVNFTSDGSVTKRGFKIEYNEGMMKEKIYSKKSIEINI